jgi:hypothetical protein
VELNPDTGRVGEAKMHGIFVVFGLQQKMVFGCLPSAGELHSTVLVMQE